MNRDEVVLLLREAVKAETKLDPAVLDKMTAESSLAELGIDSIMALEMSAYVEEKLNIQFPDGPLSRVASVADFIDLIEKQLQKGR